MIRSNKVILEDREETKESSEKSVEVLDEINIDSDCDLNESEDENQPPVKKTKYSRVFKNEWSDMAPFKNWLVKKYNTAFCKCCNSKITSGLYFITRHSKSDSHINNMKEVKSSFV